MAVTSPDRQSASGVARTCLHYVLLLAAWVGAWLAYGAFGMAARASVEQFFYWTVAKLLIWILPVLLICRHRQQQPIAAYLWLRHAGAGVRVGLLLGLGLAAVSLLADAVTKRFGWPSSGYALVNVLVIAPLFEEIVFRGFFLRELEESQVRFWPANILAALMFLGLHLPGWYFVGLLKPGQAVVALGICLVGLVAGYARRRARSTWAGVAVHFINNLYSSFMH
jgi:membrane protease YdiL (CAAX protease family)